MRLPKIRRPLYCYFRILIIQLLRVEESLTVARQLTIKGGNFIMAYVIGDDCVMCGACQAQCPADAISEGDGKYEINPDSCIDCGGCASQCPAEAITQA